MNPGERFMERYAQWRRTLRRATGFAFDDIETGGERAARIMTTSTSLDISTLACSENFAGHFDSARIFAGVDVAREPIP